MSSSIEAGFVRINQLMTQMIEAVENGDKVRLVKLARSFAEDTEDYVGVLFVAGDVSDKDVDKIDPEDTEELLKDAASAEQLRTAQVKV